jgi:hypothetical protein
MIDRNVAVHQDLPEGRVTTALRVILSKRGSSSLPHDCSQFATQYFQNGFVTRLAKRGQSPCFRPPYADRCRAHREGFENVRAVPDTAVHDNRNLASDAFDHFGQAFYGRAQTFLIWSSMIRHDETVHAVLNGDLRVFAPLVRQNLLDEWMPEIEIRSRNELSNQGYAKDYDAIVTLRLGSSRPLFALRI